MIIHSNSPIPAHQPTHPALKPIPTLPVISPVTCPTLPATGSTLPIIPLLTWPHTHVILHLHFHSSFSACPGCPLIYLHYQSLPFFKFLHRSLHLLYALFKKSPFFLYNTPFFVLPPIPCITPRVMHNSRDHLRMLMLP